MSFQKTITVIRDYFHRIMGPQILSKFHLHCHGQEHVPLELVTPSSQPSNTSRNGASKISLDNLFQCLTTPIINNLSLISDLKLPSFSLKPFPPFSATTHPCKYSLSSLVEPLQVLQQGALRFPWSLLFSRFSLSLSPC